MIDNGTIRSDGKRYDGTTWRKTGINHTMNEDGLIYYKRKYRTLDGYLQQGGKINSVVFNTVKPKDINTFVKALYNREKEGEVYVITNPSFGGWVKIGMAVDSEDRLKGYQTGDPHRSYKLEFSRYFNDRRKAESTAHVMASKSFIKSGEWFNMSVQDAINVIEGIQ
tara:strand:- start:4 stop:504 length:501 start_codon:yes stop_codon:yes gene_type:complete